MQPGKVNSIKVQAGQRQASTSLREALPKNLLWSNQVRSFQEIGQAWKTLDTEFRDQRKFIDGLLKEIISNLKSVMRDSTSLSRYATTILGFVNNMCKICVKSQADRHATNAQEDIITLFTMSSLFQLIPVGIIKPHHIQTRKVPVTTACRE